MPENGRFPAKTGGLACLQSRHIESRKMCRFCSLVTDFKGNIWDF